MHDKIVDHKGKVYKNTHEMCSHYNITDHVYRQRLRAGYDLKKALTKPVRKFKTDKQITDHEGNTYKTITEMCEYYNIPSNKYYMRIRAGWSQKDALTKNKSSEIADHHGEIFKSIEDLCKFYNISTSVFHRRKEKGWPLDKILKTKSEKNITLYNLPYPLNYIHEVINDDNFDVTTISHAQCREIMRVIRVIAKNKNFEIIENRYQLHMTLQKIADLHNKTPQYIGSNIKYYQIKIKKILIDKQIIKIPLKGSDQNDRKNTSNQ